MKDLLQLAIAAHGGLEKWNSFTKIAAHLHLDGGIWGIKGHPAIFKDVQFKAHLHEQVCGFSDYPAIGQRTTFRHDRVSIETNTGEVLAESINPRDSFAGMSWDTPWDILQLIYFSHYAVWTYLTLPFNFTLPGYEAREIEEWHEGDEIWRRLQVTTPNNIATHNKTMVFYFGPDFLLRRIDYEPDIIGSIPSAQIVRDYKIFNGITVPTKRAIYIRNEDLSYKPEPLLVFVDVIAVDFT